MHTQLAINLHLVRCAQVHHHTPTYYARLKARGRRMLLESSQPDTVALQRPTKRVYIHHEVQGCHVLGVALH